MDERLLNKYIKIDFDDFEAYKKELIKSRIPVFRINSEGRLVLVPVKKLDLFLGSGDIRKNNIEKLHLFIQKDFKRIVEEDEKVYYIQSDRMFRLSVIALSRKHAIEKLNRMKDLDDVGKNKLIEDASNSISKDIKKYGVKSSQAKNTYIDKASNIFSILFLELQGGEVNYEELNKVSYKTMCIPNNIKNFLRHITNYFSSKPPSADMFEKSYKFIDNTIMSILFRVFTLYVDFLFFYNKSFNESVVGKIRKAFKDDYMEYYIDILKAYNNVLKISKLEDVVERGMRLLSTKEILEFSIAGLLKIVVFYNHVISHTKEYEYQKKLENNLFQYGYSEETIATLSLSSNFYDYKTSVFYKDYDLKKKSNPDTNIKYAFSYDIKSLKNLEAISYFPAKALEIIYLYDSILHPDKTPEKESDILTPEQVIYIMQDSYIESSVKIDPIIFDIFVDYLNYV